MPDRRALMVNALKNTDPVEPIKYLFNKGNECIDTTGGWVNRGFNNQRDYISFSNNNGQLNLAIKGGRGDNGWHAGVTAVTNNQINISGYSKIVFVFDEQLWYDTGGYFFASTHSNEIRDTGTTIAISKGIDRALINKYGVQEYLRGNPITRTDYKYEIACSDIINTLNSSNVYINIIGVAEHPVRSMSLSIKEVYLEV